MSILVYIAQQHGQALPISWEAMGKAREMADKLGVPVVGFVVGQQVGETAKEGIAYGADKVLVADDPAFAQFRAYAFAEALQAAIAATKPSIILAPAVSGVRDAAALAACRLNIGLAADCQGLDLDAGGNLLAVRPVFSGNILTTVVFKARPQMATVRGRSFPLPAKDATRTGEIAPLTVALDELAAQEEVLSVESAEVGELSVENAGIIISGGRGVKGPEGFAPIRDLAKLLGGAVGASRAAVDAGWIPYPHQVGQTGKTVRPDLYIACGISGAIQHLAGMSNAKVIVAINKDKDAPIFGVARYGIVGDLFEVVPALTEAFRTKLGR
ncbi:MAG: electron transfer flavoprotein subunit alpha/FixB family protein [Anaerolineae bacterium]|jgi:electron transfer flavoprotein alpha subunit|nr:electron transfer flavoprotein subunit alpha/FixB family protein [Anaerolineae bacterium]